MLRLQAGLVEAFRRLDTCKVANAIETFGLRLRNEGFADSTVRAVFDDLQPIVGHAVTARIQSPDFSVERLRALVKEMA